MKARKKNKLRSLTRILQWLFFPSFAFFLLVNQVSGPDPNRPILCRARQQHIFTSKTKCFPGDFNSVRPGGRSILMPFSVPSLSSVGREPHTQKIIFPPEASLLLFDLRLLTTCCQVKVSTAYMMCVTVGGRGRGHIRGEAAGRM